MIYFQEVVVRRTSYVRSVVTLLSKSSSNTNLKSPEYPPVLDYLFIDVEYVAGSGNRFIKYNYCLYKLFLYTKGKYFNC